MAAAATVVLQRFAQLQVVGHSYFVTPWHALTTQPHCPMGSLMTWLCCGRRYDQTTTAVVLNLQVGKSLQCYSCSCSDTQLLLPSIAKSCILAAAARKSQQVIGWCCSVGILVRWSHPSGKGAITKGGSVTKPAAFAPVTARPRVAVG